MTLLCVAVSILAFFLTGVLWLTFRKRCEIVQRALDIERERYKTLVNNLPASVVISSVTNETLLCSPYTEVLTGYSLSEINNIPENIFIMSAVEEDKERIRKGLQFSMYAGEPYSTSFRYLHRSGVPMNGELRVTPLFSKAGEIHSVLSIVIDTTAAANIVTNSRLLIETSESSAIYSPTISRRPL